MATRKDMIKEAVKRMNELKLMKNVVNEFEKDGVVYYSENLGGGFSGILYWLSNEEKFVKLVKEFEEKNNAVVYHAELSHLAFGDCLSLLFVSENEDEWEDDTDDIKDGYCFVYVINLDDDSCSEFDTIGLRPANGGVVRTA